MSNAYVNMMNVPPSEVAVPTEGDILRDQSPIWHSSGRVYLPRLENGLTGTKELPSSPSSIVLALISHVTPNVEILFFVETFNFAR